MGRLISPPRDQVDRLRPPLTAGERQVLSLFCDKLSDTWEIYLQPHLNGLRPDFVLLNPQVGIAVFEVKDWDLTAMPYWVASRRDGSPVLLARSRQGIEFAVPDNPIEKIVEYKAQLLDLYCPRLGQRLTDDERVRAVITAGVIMTAATRETVAALFLPFQEHFNLCGRADPYHPLAGREDLEQGDIKRIFPESSRSQSWFMEERFAQDLRSWLVEPDHQATQRERLPLDAEQRRLVTDRPPSGYRRIKGPAGAGKSLVLAARAAELSFAKKDVLVVCYNITLWHYLRDLAKRHPSPLEARTNSITWRHFHGWCKEVCYAAGLQEQYLALFSGLSHDDDAFGPADPQLTNVLDDHLPALTTRALAACSPNVSTYDAILVDEGQDYNLDWWNLLRQVCRPGGEMLLVADETQDLYERARAWTDERMVGAGFRGDWAHLRVGYRVPAAFLPYLRRYAEHHLSDVPVDLPEPVQARLDLYPIKLRWLQIDRTDALEACVAAVLDLPGFADPDAIAMADVTMIVDFRQLGLACVQALEQRGIKVAHVFSPSKRDQQRRKRIFYMGDARVKAVTVHSFKGWEARALVVYVSRARTPEARAALYVALTRLKEHARGSFLTVVCAAPELEAYGRTWPSFERYVSSAVSVPSTPQADVPF